MRNSAFLFLGVAVLTSRVASADDSPVDPVRADVGVHVGVVLPQLGSQLGTAPGFKLDGGYVVTAGLAATVAIGYSQPSVDHTVMDPRVAGGSYTSATTQRELTVLIGGRYRFLPASSLFNAYAGAGLKFYFLKTVTDGSAGSQSFAENTEQSTRFGAAAFGGGEYRLGPGAVAVELEVGGSSLPHVTTGDVQTTAASLTLGYRMLFR